MRTAPSIHALLLALCAALCFAACSDDPESPGADTGVADAGGDTDATITCEVDTAPGDGEFCECEGGTWEGRVEICDRECLCEFGSWTCTDTCDEPDPLALELGETLTVDAQDDGGDAEINPGETWSVSGTIAAINAPEAGADTTVRLVTDSIHVTVGDNVSLTGLGADPVAFTIPFDVSDTAPGATVELTIEAFSGFAEDSASETIAITPLSIPVLELSDIAVLTDAGNPTTRIEAGDVLSIEATLTNEGTVPAEGVQVSGTPANASLSTPDALDLGTIPADAEREIAFTVTVSDTPSSLEVPFTIAVTATNADTAAEDADVTIFPADTLGVTGHTWNNTDGDNWEIVVTVENSGSFDVTGVTWSHVNYQSFPLPDIVCPDTACPSFTCDDEDPDCTPLIYVCDTDTNRCVEDPSWESIGAESPVGPTSIDGGASVEVKLPVVLVEATPAEGRILLRASSDLRSHGPFAVEVTVPD